MGGERVDEGEGWMREKGSGGEGEICQSDFRRRRGGHTSNNPYPLKIFKQ